MSQQILSIGDPQYRFSGKGECKTRHKATDLLSGGECQPCFENRFQLFDCAQKSDLIVLMDDPVMDDHILLRKSEYLTTDKELESNSEHDKPSKFPPEQKEIHNPELVYRSFYPGLGDPFLFNKGLLLPELRSPHFSARLMNSIYGCVGKKTEPSDEDPPTTVD